MKKYRLLVLTDHRGHSTENSIYPLLLEMRKHKRCAGIDVASRGLENNRLFFENRAVKNLFAAPVSQTFAWDEAGSAFKKNLERVSPRTYDAVLLRLPHPVAEEFWDFLETEFPSVYFINNPAGMLKTGNKLFMLNFPELCPPMKACHSIEDIDEMRKQFPVVLKPVMSYGGKGIVRIKGDEVVFSEGEKMSFGQFAEANHQHPEPYLAVKFLRNVTEGDKRIVVCCGEVLGAVLRYPPADSWICNVAQGGSSAESAPDENELAIVARIDPAMRENGVIFYGIDTLCDDEGRRVLSEINALSIGGLHAMRTPAGVPATKRAAELLWERIHEEHKAEK
ncbi:MAG: hypothetical protein D6816_17630 [Bacteroidetes bacterium]|nr:MAG: hypothetical protein D6816_17630 [Bacteroidota bacterium]